MDPSGTARDGRTTHDQTPETHRLKRAGAWLKRNRHIFALILLIAVAGMWLIGTFTHALRTCSDQLATVGSTPVVHVCHPLGVSDMYPLLLLVVAFLWIDIAEIAIVGVVTIKRRLESPEPRPPDRSRTEEKVQIFKEAKGNPDEVLGALGRLAQEQAAEDAAIAPLREELDKIWRDLEELLVAGNPAAPGEFWQALNDRQRRAVLGWRELFHEEIAFVRGVRAAMWHWRRRRVSRELLTQAVETGKQVRGLILSQLRHPSIVGPTGDSTTEPDDGD